MTDAGRSYGYKTAVAFHSHAYLQPAMARALASRRWAEDATMLDYGSGNGSLTAWTAGHGFKAWGVDISESGVKVASEAFPQISFSNDISAQTLKALGPFDLITCMEVLPHCFQPKQEASKLFDALKPGGMMIVSVPYYGYWKFLLLAVTGKLGAHVNPQWSGAHMYFYTIEALTALLESVGFEVTSTARVGRVGPLAKSMVLTARKPD